MAYPEFSKLQSDDRDIFEEDVPPAVLPKLTGRRRGRSFTRFELGLIITLILFATALAIYTAVYIVQHHGAIRPAAVAALSCVALLLLAVAFSIYQRIRRPNWFRDVESGSNSSQGGIKKWAISSPIPISNSQAQSNNMPSNISEMTLASKVPTYTSLSTSATITTTPSSASKGRLQKKERPTEKKGGQHRLVLWLSSSSSESRADKEYCEHLISSSARSSSEMSEVGYRPDVQTTKRQRSLWGSVFELPGDDHADSLLRPTTPELPADEDVQIVLAKPEPTARQSILHGPVQSSALDDIAAMRQSSILAVDPLRSNPFLLQQPKRDSSVRLTKSSHALGSVRVSVTPPPPSSPSGFPAPPLAPRRPRSAEPGPDRARLGYDLATVQLQIDRAAEMGEMELSSRHLNQQRQYQHQQSKGIQAGPPSRQDSRSRSRSSSRHAQDRGHQQLQQQKPQAFHTSTRALRRAKSPVVDNTIDLGRDLRRVYLEQLGSRD